MSDHQQDPLNNWERNAIVTEIEVVPGMQLHQTRLSCPWCGHKYIIVLERERKATGWAVCHDDGCGEFFKWRIDGDNWETKRVKARPKLMEDWNGTASRSSANHG